MPTSTAPAPVRRLLVVDDSRAMQAIIRRVLETAGLGALDIRVAEDGEAALQAIQQQTPSLVVSDWHMPRMSGLELLQTLRQLGRDDIPVGFVTTETDPAELDRARAQGAAFVLPKPFRDVDLVTAVGAAMRALAVTEAPPADAAARQAVEALLQDRLAGQAWRLQPDPFDLPALGERNLLALYVDEAGSGVVAIGAASLSALALLAGPAAPGTPPSDAALLGAGQALFMAAAPHLPALLGLAGTCKFKGANLVPRDFAKLRATLSSTEPARRADWRLSVVGRADGAVAFLRT